MMKIRFLAPSVIALALLAPGRAHAGLVYESAKAVVSSTTDISGAGGSSADSQFFSTVDFHLDVATRITDIGGHFGSEGRIGNNEIFGAITAVSAPGAPPADPSLSTGVLASTLLTLPDSTSTDTISGSLDVVLGPGDYALVFGSGILGASGTGLLVDTVTSPAFTGSVNTDGVTTATIRHSDGAYFGFQAGGRMFVDGVPAFSSVPEPSSLAMLAIGVGVLVVGRRRLARG